MPRSPRRSCAGAPRGGAVAIAMITSATAALGAFRVPDIEDAPSSARADAAGQASPVSLQPVVEPHLREHAEAAAQRQWIGHFALPKYVRALERLAMWERLAQCETGADWRDGGDYSGGLGIYIGTWRAYGGGEFAPRPQDATKEEQIEVAERIARDGMGGWGCAHRLGLAG